MTRPALPTSYNEDETKAFHPVFEWAANKVIAENGWSGVLDIKHHYAVGSLIVDFAFIHKSTLKIFLLVEVKRTKAAVQSTRYRNQARNYYQQGRPNCLLDYYALTNLEHTDVFRERTGITDVNAQLIAGCPLSAGDLFSNPSFYDDLCAQIKKLLLIIFEEMENKTTPEYSSELHTLGSALRSLPDTDNSRWHQILMPASYQYILSASTKSPALLSQVKKHGWRPAITEKLTPNKLSERGRAVDFEKIFCDPLPDSNDASAFDSGILNEAQHNGSVRGEADDIGQLIYGIVSEIRNSTQGVVETDEELAKVLAAIAKDSLGSELDTSKKMCDPAAGTGRLLAAGQNLFKTIEPRQIWANDIEQRFSEILALKMGLLNPNLISPTNKPRVTVADVLELKPNDFAEVQVVLLNPPFVRGVDCADLRIRFEDAIKLISGQSYTNSGQIGLECVFLELVWHLVPEGSVVAAIMPHRLLLGTSKEVANFRHFISEQFGIKAITTYLDDGIFEDVTKKTFILSGVKGSASKEVKLITLNIPLANLDINHFLDSVAKSTSNLGMGITIKVEKVERLSKYADSGWGDFLGSRELGKKFFASLHDNTKIKLNTIKSVLGIKRGPAGNSGGSDLIFLKPNTEILDLVPDSWRMPGQRNTDNLPKQLTRATADSISFYPPAEAFDEDTEENELLLAVFEQHLKNIPAASGVQAKKSQTIESLAEIIKKSNKAISVGTILVPRSQRREGKIGYIEEASVISTNMLCLQSSIVDAPIISSWLFSVFGQLQMEITGINQEGARKLEKEQIESIFIPSVSDIAAEDKENLCKLFSVSSPIDFYNIKTPRELDLAWARSLRVANPEQLTLEAYQLLLLLCEERQPKS